MAESKTIARTATEGLKILWEEKFFRNWKKRDAVVQELSRRDNHFSDAELGMALLRAAHLTRRGRRGSYEYIQKYPHAPDEVPTTTKEKKVQRDGH